ncbi:MAG: hypothetical protein AAF969_00715 [Bacteroidota bacterium]
MFFGPELTNARFELMDGPVDLTDGFKKMTAPNHYRAAALSLYQEYVLHQILFLTYHLGGTG